MNMLTVRKLPVHEFERAGTDTKWRIDSNLVRLIADSLHLEHPGMKFSRRFCLEYVLMKYLADKGLIKSAPSLPESPSLAELLLAEFDAEEKK